MAVHGGFCTRLQAKGIPTVAPQSLALGGQCLAIIKLPEALEI